MVGKEGGGDDCVFGVGGDLVLWILVEVDGVWYMRGEVGGGRMVGGVGMGWVLGRSSDCVGCGLVFLGIV